MEELPQELLDELVKPEKKPRSRKTKNPDRTYKAWFYEIETHNGDCTNPNCKDDRGKAKGITMVWSTPDGNSMCRFCFIDGWKL